MRVCSLFLWIQIRNDAAADIQQDDEHHGRCQDLFCIDFSVFIHQFKIVSGGIDLQEQIEEECQLGQRE